MKKLLALIFLISSYANAQFGTVSATITDGAGQAFNNGTYKVELVPAFGFGNPVRTDTGLPVTPTQVNGVLDGTGSFAGVVLTRTDFIGPAGSLWKFTICPDATSGCFTYSTTITTSTPSLTAQLSAAAGTIVVGTQFIKNIIPTAYASTELFGMTKGSLYYNTTSNGLFNYDGTTWNAVGGLFTGGAITSPITAAGGTLCTAPSYSYTGFTNWGQGKDTNGIEWCMNGSLFWRWDSAGQFHIAGSLGAASAGIYIDSSMGSNVGTITRSAGGGLNISNAVGDFNISAGSSGGNILLVTNQTGKGLFLIPNATGQVTIGNTPSATPAARIFQVGESASGANLAGASGQINCGGAGTGSGGGGTCTFATAVAHGSDSVLDTFTTAMTIDASQNTNITKLKINGSQALTGVQGTTGTSAVTATGSFISGNLTKTDANGNLVDAGSPTYAPVASVDLTSQNAAIGTTTLFAVTNAGQYRVSWNSKVTTAAGTSSNLGALTIVYTDPDGTVMTITGIASLSSGSILTTNGGNLTTSILLGLPITLNCKAGTNITYAMAYTSNPANAMNYNLHIRAESVN